MFKVGNGSTMMMASMDDDGRACSPTARPELEEKLDKERATKRLLQHAKGLITEQLFAKVLKDLEGGFGSADQKVLKLMSSLKSIDPCLAKRCVLRVQNSTDAVLEATRFCTCGAASPNLACRKRTLSEVGVISASTTQSKHLRVDPGVWFNAVVKGKIEWVKNALSNKTVDVNAVDKHGMTGLMVAAKYGGATESMQLLIENGCKLDTADSLVGRTALIWAVVSNKLEAVETLVEAGADIEVTSKDGLNALLLAARLGYANIAQYLIRRGANKECKDGSGLTAAMFAASYGHTATIVMLAREGVHLDCRDKLGCTPLMLASRAGRYETVLALTELGSDVNAVCLKGYTALHYAARAGHATTVIALLSSSTVGTTCSTLLCLPCKEHGNTPFMLACEFGRTETACVLFRNGSRLEAKNNQGLTGIQLASLEGHEQCVKEILKCMPSM